MVSFVVPCYNEEGNVRLIYDEIHRVFDAREIPVEIVDEYRTTDDARRAYWKAHPPRGWRRFLPTGMQVPPVPVDDFVAVLLAQRYLTHRNA